MKKKILSIFTILALILVNSGCSGSPELTPVPDVALIPFTPPPAPLTPAPAPAVSITTLPGGTVGVPGIPWAWGSKGATGLGDGKAADSKIPVPLSSLSGVVDIAAGYLHVLALKSDGSVWAWGLNSEGQLGDGTKINRNTPVQVSVLTGVKAITAGKEHSLALKADGTVWAWGGHALIFSLLGNGVYNNADVLIPVQVNGLTGVTAVAAGNEHSLALKSDGTVWAWGGNYYGQLGIGSNAVGAVPVQSAVPVQVSGLTGVKAIAASSQHSLALKTDETVWAWGYNYYGQLGYSPSGGSAVPVPVSGVTGVKAIAAGKGHSLAVKSDGTVWAWGHNNDGQLGDNTVVSRQVPAQVSGLTGVTAVAAGQSHSLALKSDGTVWAWGYNYYGQLGDNTTTNRRVPVQVSGLTGVTAIAGKNFHSLALK